MGKKLDKIIRLQEQIIAMLEGAEKKSVVDLKRRQALQRTLNESLCTAVQLGPGDDRIQLYTPFDFSDGDPYMIYLKELPTGDLRLTDGGHTLMHLRYEKYIAGFRDGTHGKALKSILNNMYIQENGGELFVDFPSETLGSHLLRFGQAIAMVCVLAEKKMD